MKNFFTIVMVLVSLVSWSQEEVQKYKFVPEGINGYVVLEFPDKSAEEIYSSLTKWAEYNIRSAEYSNYSTIENEFLTYRLILPEAIEYKTFVGPIYYNIEMDVLYRLKPGRLRIDLENINIPHSVEGQAINIKGSRAWGQSFYDNKGRERSQFSEKKEQGEKALNDFLKEIEEAITKNPDYQTSDW